MDFLPRVIFAFGVCKFCICLVSCECICLFSIKYLSKTLVICQVVVITRIELFYVLLCLLLAVVRVLYVVPWLACNDHSYIELLVLCFV